MVWPSVSSSQPGGVSLKSKRRGELEKNWFISVQRLCFSHAIIKRMNRYLQTRRDNALDSGNVDSIFPPHSGGTMAAMLLPATF